MESTCDFKRAVTGLHVQEFEDDSLEPAAHGETIEITYDESHGRLSVVYKDRNRGTIDGISGDDLRFFCEFGLASVGCGVVPLLLSM